MAEPMTFIFAGKSGAGKGTQATLLMKYLAENEATRDLPVVHLETGQRFRDFMNGSTYTARLAKEAVSKGQLLPAYLAVWNWAAGLIELMTGKEHIVVDGTPRVILEAQAFEDALKFYNREKVYVIYLNVEDGTATTRLKKRGRGDDEDESIARRLAWFPSDALPAVMYYKDRPGYHFIELDGSPSIEEVHQSLINAIWSV